MQETNNAATAMPNPAMASSKYLESLKHWEAWLLALVALGIVSMSAWLLWPQPQVVLNLQAYPATRIAASNAAALLPETSSIADAESETSTEKTAPKTVHRHYTSHKKPAKPPVLNLNSASGAQLQLLPGIGPKMAQRILEYRKSSGGFRSIEQVMEVNGIGPKKFEKLKPYLKV